MPRGRGRGARRGHAAARQLARVERNLGPVPTAVVPPPDPPTVRSNKPITAWIDATPALRADGSYQYHSQSMQQLVKARLGIEEANFVLLEAHAWGDLAGGHWIVMSDYETSVQCTDEGSYAVRPRVGLFYPKNIQKVWVYGAPSTVMFTVTVPNVTNLVDPKPYDVAVRVRVTAWEKTVDFPKELRFDTSPPDSTAFVHL